MKNILILLSVLVFVGCDTKHIALYTIKMMYACECPQYRVFRIEDNNNLPANRHNISIDKALDDEIQYALYMNDKEDNSVSSHNADSLIGWDIDLVFDNKESEKKFLQDEGISPICNIYYLEGELQSTLLGKPVLLVKDFKIFYKSPQCDS
ncbi:hypothetical protein T36_0495 [Helicobacter cinaedi]|uniref:hypothetical protein n=1 Tax=Helicobacter cinaedi TaxID=213 RepID=UPI001F3D5E7B|nr:hypothetical protein [Helicobacter cinaedi]BDB64048.1 hypothetical protein T36_0495 [Helicobacter cinaedi]